MPQPAPGSVPAWQGGSASQMARQAVTQHAAGPGQPPGSQPQMPQPAQMPGVKMGNVKSAARSAAGCDLLDIAAGTGSAAAGDTGRQIAAMGNGGRHWRGAALAKTGFVPGPELTGDVDSLGNLPDPASTFCLIAVATTQRASPRRRVAPRFRRRRESGSRSLAGTSGPRRRDGRAPGGHVRADCDSQRRHISGSVSNLILDCQTGRFSCFGCQLICRGESHSSEHHGFLRDNVASGRHQRVRCLLGDNRKKPISWCRLIGLT